MMDDLKFNEDPNIDKNESVESLSDREKAWESAFWDEYKPDFSYKNFFLNIKSRYYDYGNWFSLRPGYDFDDDKKVFGEIFRLLENNWFKINIQFLESLNDKQRKHLSFLFLDFLDKRGRLKAKLNMGKSLLIYFCRYGHRYDNHFENFQLENVSENFSGFNLKYFRQAYDCIRRIWDNDIHHIISEYNLIKNIDNDITLPEISKLKLWKDFSLQVFHARSDTIWFWYEETRWNKEFDKNGNETKFKDIWDKLVFDEKWHYRILDRNRPSTYRIASWIAYQEYLDSPTWIALFYKNRPVACISFYIKNWNEFFINQIQKVPYYEYDRHGRCTWKHYSSITNDIDWQNTLYNVVKNLANKYNISRIIIQWWENNKRTKEIYEDYETDYFKNKIFWLDESIPPKNKGKIHLDPQIAKKIYDVFAEWLWFRKKDDWNREIEI